MKTLLLYLPFAFSLFATQAAYSAVGDTRQKESKHSVVERGANHRIWQRVTLETNAVGKVRARTNSYTELKTGMHFKNANGKWVDSEATIEITPTGASARKGAHAVDFAANINTIGAIKLTMPDGKRMRSHVLGLSYFDTATGQSAMIAEIKDSIGLLAPPNQIFYPDAFTEVKADIGYTYSAHGFEQDIILRAQLPSPEEYGLNPETTQLEVLTEFIESPAPTKSVERLKNGAIDETLAFTTMQIGSGRAFSLGETNGSSEATSVLKRWTQMEGRDFLIEALPYVTIEGKLAELPKEEAKAPGKGAKTARAAATKIRKLPVIREARLGKERIEVASIAETPGFLIDYLITLSGGTSYTNYTFKGDTTYYVSGIVNLYGTTTLEGGTVIKYSTSGSVYISSMNGLFDCKTDSYRPAVFTSKNDNSVGEIISGSTGSPAEYEYEACFAFKGGTPVLSNVRFSYASWPCSFWGGSNGGEIRDAQYVKCAIPINSEGKAIRLRNVLITGCMAPLRGNGSYSIAAENVTIDDASHYLSGPGSGTIFLTNSIVVAVTSLGAATITTNESLVSVSSIPGTFQTVGAASYYLATNSVYRNAGTTNINATLLTDLREKTTYPPIVYSNVTQTSDITLMPNAQRDTDVPDLGYHYDSLDFALGSFLATNCTVTIAPGTAIATFSAGSGYGIGIGNGSTFNAEGEPDRLNYIVSYNTVQEQSNTNWLSLGHSAVTTTGSGSSPVAAANFRQTLWSSLGFSGIHLSLNHEYLPRVDIRDSQFFGGWFHGFAPALYLTNNLFHRVNTYLFEYTGIAFSLQNNTFYGGWCFFEFYTPSVNRTYRNNLFVLTEITQTESETNDFNAFYDVPYALTPTGASNVVVTNLTFETGPLGDFYLSTNNVKLLSTGSTNANLLALYHYTTAINQVKETNSIVDRGFHYVALNEQDEPIDTDGDGIPDYKEDGDGNGTFDTADFSNWGDSDTDDDGVNDYTEWLQGRNPLLPGSANENGLIQLNLYSPLK